MKIRIIAIASAVIDDVTGEMLYSAGAGKTTAMNILQNDERLEGWHFASTSETLVEELSYRKGIPEYQILDNKEAYREELVRLGNEDKLFAMVKTLSNCPKGKNIVIESVRRTEEVWLLKEFSANYILISTLRSLADSRRSQKPKQDINTAYDILTDLKGCYQAHNNTTEDSLANRLHEIVGFILEEGQSLQVA